MKKQKTKVKNMIEMICRRYDNSNIVEIGVFGKGLEI